MNTSVKHYPFDSCQIAFFDSCIGSKRYPHILFGCQTYFFFHIVYMQNRIEPFFCGVAVDYKFVLAISHTRVGVPVYIVLQHCVYRAQTTALKIDSQTKENQRRKEIFAFQCCIQRFCSRFSKIFAVNNQSHRKSSERKDF